MQPQWKLPKSTKSENSSHLTLNESASFDVLSNIIFLLFLSHNFLSTGGVQKGSNA